MSNYEIVDAGAGRHAKIWNRGVEFDDNTIEQLKSAARLSCVHPYVAAMPDAHLGYGSTVGSVIPTRDAVIPSAVGVDIGCGMIFQPLNIKRSDLPADLGELRAALEHAIPNGGPGDVGAWSKPPARVQENWDYNFADEYTALGREYPEVISPLAARQLGTLGTGNHFVELVSANTWVDNIGIVIHSGSRGLGNKIGTLFSRIAREYCERNNIELPDKDLAFLPRGTKAFEDYVYAVTFAQRYAWQNRLIMLGSARWTLNSFSNKPVEGDETIHCHHNYLAEEIHFGEKLFITRKGAVRAEKGDLGIIPGSMGARTYIVAGLGSEDSFKSCSHGAGRKMSRTAAKKAFTVEQHAAATAGVECDKTAGTLDETPGCYKDIEAVMAAQSDLVQPLLTVKQFLCLKGIGQEKKWRKKKAEVVL